MNEICLHGHWLYFSSIIMSFGQGAYVVVLSPIIPTDPHRLAQVCVKNPQQVKTNATSVWVPVLLLPNINSKKRLTIEIPRKKYVIILLCFKFYGKSLGSQNGAVKR